MAVTDRDGTVVDHLEEELSGLDTLELAAEGGPRRSHRLWAATWPKLVAASLAIALWQVLVWIEWRSQVVLKPPAEVFSELWELMRDGTMATAAWITLRRAVVGFTVAIGVGVVVGSLVAQIGVLRRAVGAMITGLQTMPSIAWFPLAILLYQLSEAAILFVVVLGAAPAIANGLIAGIDQTPPILLRAGRVLGAGRLAMLRHVVLPASLPGFVAGLKQGWAFAWRSLMAGELIVLIPGKESMGYLLQVNRQLNDSAGLLATMIAILVIGIVVDSVLFGFLERSIRQRWGLLDTTH